MGSLVRHLSLVVFLFFSALTHGEVIIGPAPQNAGKTLDQIEAHILLLESMEPTIPDHRREQVAKRTSRLSRLLDRLADEIAHGGGSGHVGEWIAAVGQECVSACRAAGLESSLSPEGSQCVSGETRPASAMGVVPMAHGCWPNCAPQADAQGVSVGGFCYRAGQKRDNDRTDKTVGCFCR